MEDTINKNIVPEEQQAPSEKAAEKSVFFSKKKGLKIAIIAVALALALFLVVVTAVNSSPTKIAEKYAVAEFNDDLKTMDKLSAIDIKAQIADYNYLTPLLASYNDYIMAYYSDLSVENIDVNSWDEYCKAVKSITKMDNIDEYGNYSITPYTFGSKDEDLVEMLEYFDGEIEYGMRYGLSTDNITGIKSVTVYMKMDTQDETYVEEYDIILINQNGWKVVYSY